MPVPYFPIAVPNRGPTKNQYMTVRRWLLRLPWWSFIRTEQQLRHALRKPDVFYIVPQEHR